MSLQTSVKINGKDVRSIFGFEVTNITPFGPLKNFRNEIDKSIHFGTQFESENITLEGYIEQASNTALHQAIELLASEFGAYGGRAKKALLEIMYFTSGSASGSACYEIIFNGQFDVSHFGEGGRAVAETAQIRVGFVIISYIYPDGQTTRTVDITTATYNWFFEDSNCLQGAKNLIATFRNTGGSPGAYPDITALAVSDRFIHYPSWYLGVNQTASGPGGTAGWDIGPFGNPSLAVTSSLNNALQFPKRYALPIEQNYETTILIRFRWGGAMTVGQKYLLELDTSTSQRFLISFVAASATDHVLHFITNGVDLYATLPNGFSSTDWNVIVIRYKDNDTNGKSIWVNVPGEDVVTATAADEGLITTTGSYYFYLGSSKTGTAEIESYLGEIAIWKHALSDAACLAACQSIIPIRNNSAYELNRRLTFYLDFNDGYKAICNRHYGVKTSNYLANLADLYMFDSERMSCMKITGSGGVVSDIAYLASSMGNDDVPLLPMLERYNNLLIQPIGAMGTRVALNYNPMRRL